MQITFFSLEGKALHVITRQEHSVIPRIGELVQLPGQRGTFTVEKVSYKYQYCSPFVYIYLK